MFNHCNKFEIFLHDFFNAVGIYSFKITVSHNCQILLDLNYIVKQQLFEYTAYIKFDEFFEIIWNEIFAECEPSNEDAKKYTDCKEKMEVSFNSFIFCVLFRPPYLVIYRKQITWIDTERNASVQNEVRNLKLRLLMLF